ncbi:MAG TPA: HipA domain-containing protein [Nitriliruptorales bacterium]
MTTKDWLLPRDSGPTDPEWLWKGTPVEATGLHRVLGHDWGERVACEVAKLLAVPAAVVELGSLDGDRGVVCRSFASARAGHPSLSNASELLPTVVAGYDQDKTGVAPGYTLDAVFDVLAESAAPAGSDPVVADGQTAFAGVLMMDALIANQDRHHDNWGVVQAPEGTKQLAPAFDQACCLGYQATADDKRRRIEEGRVEEWAARGRSNQFEGKPNLVELAHEALGRVPEDGAKFWLERLESVTLEQMRIVIDRVPGDRMSQVDRTFAVEVMRVNRRRILDGWDAPGD